MKNNKDGPNIVLNTRYPNDEFYSWKLNYGKDKPVKHWFIYRSDEMFREISQYYHTMWEYSKTNTLEGVEVQINKDIHPLNDRCFQLIFKIIDIHGREEQLSLEMEVHCNCWHK